MAERATPLDPTFNKWTKYGDLLRRRYEFCNKYIQGKRVVDIPCGTGYGVEFLNGYSSYWGIDVCQSAILFANERYGGKNIEFFIQDMVNCSDFLGLHAPDVILCLDGLEHLNREDGKLFVRGIRKALAPGGLFILTVPILFPDGRGSNNPYHLYEYPEKELFNLFLDNTFTFIYLERYMGDTPMFRMVVKKI